MNSLVPLNSLYNVSNSGPYSRIFIPGTGETIKVFSPIFWKDDFLGDVIADEWNVCVGSDSGAPTIAIDPGLRGGQLKFTTGNDGNATVATRYGTDSAMLNSGLNFRADAGGLGMEVRMCMDTAVTSGTMGMGFTDVLSATGSVEQPSSYVTTTLTTNASNGLGFLFDTPATVDDWIAWGVKADTDTASTHSGTAYAPVEDTFQILRLEIDASGAAAWYINDVLIHSVAAAVTATTLLTPYVYFNSTTTAAIVGHLDYVAVWSGR